MNRPPHPSHSATRPSPRLPVQRPRAARARLGRLAGRLLTGRLAFGISGWLDLLAIVPMLVRYGLSRLRAGGKSGS